MDLPAGVYIDVQGQRDEAYLLIPLLPFKEGEASRCIR